MEAIIGGKRYNTDKADLIAEFTAAQSTSDFRWYTEGLYLSRRGAWFLAGRGHGLSPYRQRYIDGWGQGSSVRPLSPAEAQAWLEEHDEIEAIEDHFGDLIDDA